jgi:hypothetical protein
MVIIKVVGLVTRASLNPPELPADLFFLEKIITSFAEA